MPEVTIYHRINFMRLDGSYVGPISSDDLLQFKALPPLSNSAKIEVIKIADVDVTDFNEAEVRAFVIDPLIRILGYDKGTSFSVNLGKALEFLGGKNKFFDYSFLLWEEHFWLIEAKRPIFNADSFDYETLAQALEYATHPKVNAALVVLCDGIKIEIFDREVDITTPILRVKVKDLQEDFDKVRSILDPIQVWFFQKRRVVRLIDKVFDREFNMQRVEEFRSLVDRRLDGKRQTVLNNFRSNVKSDPSSFLLLIEDASLEDLTEVLIFQTHTIAATKAIVDTLVKLWKKNSFKVTYGLFPDAPRDTNDSATAHSLAFLFALSSESEKTAWLPSWLHHTQGAEGEVADAAHRMLLLCLTHFESDEPRKMVLLASATLRRINKLLIQSSERHWKIGQAGHILHRFLEPEITWSQIVSSPNNHVLNWIESNTITATRRFVTDCMSKGGKFQTEVAKLRLKELWRSEIELLRNIGNYPELRKERDIGELHPTEANCVTHDYLGHMALCLLEYYPTGLNYAIQHHNDEIHKIAAMGSWKAFDILKLNRHNKIQPVPDADLAQRFFLGDTETLNTLKTAYFG